ncbi:hypothetical protein FQU76_29075 [Streptomyces qinzhouensis]|uniref:Uncharacterized protein n=1 Tax=Streptomyces qinzhouensis TaxID=2599401 RepID=A0A5B8JJE0_9ACTN|nr:hypothetical protein FQU76_29075 [Streptomyces qinzhouensis]
MKASPLVPVPIPDRVAALIGSCMPERVLMAEMEADCAVREMELLRQPLRGAQAADRERLLSAVARANKVLAAYNPRLMILPGSGY